MATAGPVVGHQWLMAAGRAREILCESLAFEDPRNVVDIAAAILIMNGLAARLDCPFCFQSLAATDILDANGEWGPRAQAAYEALKTYT